MKTLLNQRIVFICFFFLLFHSFTASAQTTLIDYGATWKYLDNGSNQGTAWTAAAFNDATWASGASELGYGDAPATTVSYGSDANNKYVTTYFRKTINITNLNTYGSLTLNVVRDDGMVVYVNGVEVARDNMPAGTPAYNTYASSAISGASESTAVSFSLSPCLFTEGSNTIAVEMHQNAANSTDLSFNLQLTASALGGTPTLSRGPYLQMGSQTAITVRWRTSVACYGKVEVGPSSGTYTTASATETCPTTEHIIRVTGLSPDTKYYYRIVSSTGTVFQGSTDNFFTTVPPPSTTRKIRIAAFGDCGRNSATYQDENLTNYRSYLTTKGIDAPDAWILMGDNAYSSGTDAEYTTNFFGIYGSNLLKNHKLYPAPGNHDYANNTANKASRSMAYYNNFSTPQSAECGGVASNKPNFYSFDIGNIHFLSLDAWGTETDGTHMGTNGTSQLKTWINNDLAANTQKWTIAYWHHPPYTKTSHNSDTETELQNIRQNFITYLESRGVDMIICGHSHGYERGYLLRNFTTGWTTFNAGTHAVSTSSGAYTSNTTCPYVYNSTPLNHGTVYVVAGSTGASGGVQTDFDTYAFPYSVNDGGVLYFEVEGNRLDAKMLRRNGTIFDQFTIMKDVNKTTTTNVTAGTPVTLTASWPADAASNFSWNTGTDGRSISVTPPLGTSNYTVTDNYGCVTDNFTVNVLSMLPVNLDKFLVYPQRGKVLVDWTTTTEENSQSFTVERSVDGKNFDPVSRVPAAGQSATPKKYSVTDASPLKGTSYYRLLQTDLDGRMKLSEVKKIVNVNGPSFDVKLSSTGAMVTITMTSSVSGKVALRVFDMHGREVEAKSWAVNAGNTQGQIRLSRGSYILNFTNDLQESMVRKIIID